MSHDLATHHGGAVVVVLVRWFPGLQAAPAEAVVALGTGHTEEAKHQSANEIQSVCTYGRSCVRGGLLQAALILLDLGVAAGATL